MVDILHRVYAFLERGEILSFEEITRVLPKVEMSHIGG